jgi:hypothetical protein
MVWVAMVSSALATYIPAGEVEALRAALAQARPGDRIVLANGEWRDVTLVVEAEGTADAPILLQAETDGHVLFTGHSTLRLGGRHLVVRGLHFTRGYTDGQSVIEFRTSPQRAAEHVRLTRCAIIAYNAPSLATRYAWVRLYGRHNQVDHCLFQDHAHRGVTVQVMLDGVPNDHVIEYNYFLKRPPGHENGFEVIQVGQAPTSLTVSRTLVQHNLFEACDGEIEVISNKSGENVYRHNTFRRSQGTLTLRHGDDAVAEYNVFLGEGLPETGGIRIVGERHRVRHNYFHRVAGRTGGVIALYTGIPDSPLVGYVAAHDLSLESNMLVDNLGNALTLSAGWGRHGRVILPERVQVRSNLFQQDSRHATAVVAGEAGSAAFADNFYHEASEVGGARAGLTLAPLRRELLANGLVRIHLDDTELPAPAAPPFTAVERLRVLRPFEVGPEWWHAARRREPAQQFRPFLLDRDRLLRLRAAGAVGELPSAPALARLRARAAEILAARTRYAVTFNDSLPASGDPHDYYSVGPYWWPNPDTPDGLPYVRRDGEFNPRRDQISDREPLRRMVDDVLHLALAWAVFGEDEQADWAVQLLHTWFLDPATRMNPHLRFAQAIPGRVTGRGTGIIDTMVFTELVEAMQILRASPAWCDATEAGLRDWFDRYLDWLWDHPHGIAERTARNNHGTAYDVQVVSLARFVQREELARNVLREYTRERAVRQIEADGRQPLELERTRSWSYVTENLRHFFRLARLGRELGEDLLDPRQPAGARLWAALDYVLPYHPEPMVAWPYPQVTDWQHAYVREVLRHATAVRPAGSPYHEALALLPAADPDVWRYFLAGAQAGD